MNALSAMEREDELVSSFYPQAFAFSSLLSDRLPFPHSAATTLAAVSTSRTSMPSWSTLKSAMLSSSTRALSWGPAKLIPPTIQLLLPTANTIRISRTLPSFLGPKNSTSNFRPSSNHTTTSTNNSSSNKVRSTQMTWNSTWTLPPLRRLRHLLPSPQ